MTQEIRDTAISRDASLFGWCQDNFPERPAQLIAYRTLGLLCQKSHSGTQRVLDIIHCSRNISRESENDRPDTDWGIPADLDEHDRAIWLRRCKALNMTYQKYRESEQKVLLEHAMRNPAIMDLIVAEAIKEYGLNHG